MYIFNLLYTMRQMYASIRPNQCRTYERSNERKNVQQSNRATTVAASKMQKKKMKKIHMCDVTAELALPRLT